MCQRLLDTGHEVVVFDLDDAAVDAMVTLGARAATSSAEVAAASDTMSICVPADAHVLAVLRGESGVEGGGRGGLTVLIHSTVHPDTMREAHNAAATWGVAVHDACVAGGDDAARNGQLVLFVSDLDSMAPHARATVDTFGSRVIATGPPGSGAAVKIGVNVMTYAQQAALTAAFELVTAQGASTDALVEAWRHNGQFGPIIERFSALMGFPIESLAGMRDYLSNVVAIEQKDLALAVALGEGTPRGPSPVVAAISDYAPTMFGLS
jgi:3-hydroxyisobutyrate dehydrogenase-like beta-hydroxyacid dehydrogenase